MNIKNILGNKLQCQLHDRIYEVKNRLYKLLCNQLDNQLNDQLYVQTTGKLYHQLYNRLDFRVHEL